MGERRGSNESKARTEYFAEHNSKSSEESEGGDSWFERGVPSLSKVEDGPDDYERRENQDDTKIQIKHSSSHY